jgi:hypothetical protein
LFISGSFFSLFLGAFGFLFFEFGIIFTTKRNEKRK